MIMRLSGKFKVHHCNRIFIPTLHCIGIFLLSTASRCGQRYAVYQLELGVLQLRRKSLLGPSPCSNRQLPLWHLNIYKGIKPQVIDKKLGRWSKKYEEQVAWLVPVAKFRFQLYITYWERAVVCGEEERGLVCDVRVSRRLLQRDVRRAQPILYPEQANTHWCLTHTYSATQLYNRLCHIWSVLWGNVQTNIISQYVSSTEHYKHKVTLCIGILDGWSVRLFL